MTYAQDKLLDLVGVGRNIMVSKMPMNRHTAEEQTVKTESIAKVHHFVSHPNHGRDRLRRHSSVP